MMLEVDKGPGGTIRVVLLSHSLYCQVVSRNNNLWQSQVEKEHYSITF